MAAGKATIVDLLGEVDDLKFRFPSLTNDQLFVLWFQHAYLVDGETKAALGHALQGKGS